MWFVRYGSASTARTRVIAFPFAGGGPSVYREWAERLTGVEVCAACLPGRERRAAEPPVGHLGDLVAALAAAVRELADRPFVLVGHSMGAILAFEIARALQRHHVFPRHLVAVASRAPSSSRRSGRTLHLLPDAEFARVLREFGGSPGVLLDDSTLFAPLVPMLRADFAVDETYIYRAGPPLGCPITAIEATRDPFVVPGEMKAWARHTRGEFAWCMLEGSHFFVEDRMATLTRAIGELLS
jgi:medium-chain acyl-[acyl-carrier-protein] hydrolase